MQIASTPTTIASSPMPLGSVDRVLSDFRAETHAPGVVVSIRRGGAPLLDAVSGVADLATRRPLTVDDKFHAASTSKLVVGATVLKLAELGKLSLDDTLAKWLPTYPDADKITVDMLLDQRTGVPDIQNSPQYDHDNNSSTSMPWSWSKELSTMERMPQTQVHGKDFAYSNGNYQLLSYIAQQAGGKPYGDVARDLVFAPAGVSGAVFEGGFGRTAATVTPYFNDPQQPSLVDVSSFTDSGSTQRTTILGAGALVTNAAGLAKLGEAIMSNDGAVLGATTRTRARAEADQPVTTSIDAGKYVVGPYHLNGYGPGMWSEQIPMPDGSSLKVYGHDGGYQGETSIVLHDPTTATTVSIMDNVQSLTMTEPMLKLAGQLFAQARQLPHAIATKPD